MENHSFKVTVRKLIIQLADPGGLLYKAWVCNHLIAGILMLILVYLLTAVGLTPDGSSTVHKQNTEQQDENGTYRTEYT